jgi:hypothetical protein
MRSFSIFRRRSILTAALLALFIASGMTLGLTSDLAFGASGDRDTPSEETETSNEVSGAVTDTDEFENDMVVAQAGSSKSGAELLPGGDTRPARLEASTSSWNTDWYLRTIELYELLHGGPPRDGIPSIDQPHFVDAAEADAWLEGNEPVIALIRGSDARAYPLQILIWHEIVNDVVNGEPLLITFCPLCNSSIVFDRRVGSEVYEFGTSGLLRNSDLVMYDRSTESLWQQLTGDGIVGRHAGDRLAFIPSSIVSFDEFRNAYPDGRILSKQTGYARSYGSNPYVGYDNVGQSPFLFSGEIDGRLTAMERVVAVTLSADSRELNVAYPYSILDKERVINDVQSGIQIVVFHQSGTSSALDTLDIAEGRDVGATGVFRTEIDGKQLEFTVRGDEITDRNTGSSWDIFGRAVEGPLKGSQLEPVVHGDHFWFAWAAFKPDTIVYSKE